MTTLPWFRMYGEFLTDPLIRLLSFEDQRHFIAALCMKSSGVTDKCYASVTVRRNVISALIGLSCDSVTGISALDQANERLRALGLIDENWQPTNWNKRQFFSDHEDRTAAERMRRYRAKRNVTPVTPVVTALDTDTDTDTDTEQSKKKTVRGASRPRATKASKCPPDFVPDLSVTLAKLPDLDFEAELTKFRDWEFKTPRSDWDACWRTWVQNAKERGQYAKKQSTVRKWE